jgi:6-pyruvoyltetrahydropterin/6-carboxytetrahydropterin synthase
MYKVCKTFKVPIGHRLSKHKGLCKNIHGHNLKIEIELTTSDLDKNDMVIDFHELKSIANDILDKYDHTTIFNIKDKNNAAFFQTAGYRTAYISPLDVDPTAEVFSRFIYDKLVERFNLDNIYVGFVRVWENDDSYAEYME